MDSSSYDQDHALIARIAWLYYNDGLTQSEIGELLSMSRIKVSRLLDAGREAGLIQIHVNSLHHGCHEAESALIKRYGLSDCRVIPDGVSLTRSERLGAAAAQFLMQKLQAGNLLAVGWGETVSSAIRKLGHTAQERGISLVTLTGGVQTYVDGLRAAHWDRGLHILPAPLVLSDPALAQALKSEAVIASLLEMALSADFKLVGVGGLNTAATVVRQGYIAPAEVEPLRRKGAVGDILFHFFDKDGKALDLPLHDRVISVGFERLCDTKNVIGVAGGPEKVEAIRGAIEGRLIDILITDEETSLRLLD